ncbi:MAG: hypothetical protein ACRCZ9_05640 [Fusobacteriaceae bacterium]
MFREISPSDFPKLDPSQYPDYYMDGIFTVGDRVFTDGETFVELHVDEGVPFLSMINVYGRCHIFSLKIVADEIMNEYGKLGFSWKKDIKNQKYIKRLSSNYKIIKEFLDCDTDEYSVVLEKI